MTIEDAEEDFAAIVRTLEPGGRVIEPDAPVRPGGGVGEGTASLVLVLVQEQDIESAARDLLSRNRG